MTEREQAVLDAMLNAMLEQLAITQGSCSMPQVRTCAKCGEDVTYWVTPCAEPGCPAVKQDS
jgi:hypothetical protein